MKHFLTLLLMLVSMVVSAQNVVTFLGIPVDGTESSMKAKLKEKGFKVQSDGSLTGEFNGYLCGIVITTNHSKVDRIVVVFPWVSNESDAIANFNTLLRQFDGSVNYYSHSGNSEIPSSEDISYEMLIHNKRYEAAFYQKGDRAELVWFMLEEQYGKYRILLYYDNEHNRPNGSDL